MFSKSITESDAFLDLTLSAQALYFHLSMNADDEGFVNSAKRITNMCGASKDDLQVLLDKSFLISFESGVLVIKHWKINNKLRKDRSRQTNYPEEKNLLAEKTNGVYTLKNEKKTSEYETFAEHYNCLPPEEDDGTDNEPDEEVVKESLTTETQKEEKAVETEPQADENFEYESETGARKSYAETVYDLYSSHGLPCASNIISFQMRDFRLALTAIQKLRLSSDEVIQAVKNYIEVVELKRQGKTWWSSEQSFNNFCEKNTIMKFLPDYFKLEDFYKDKGAKNTDTALEGKIQL